MTRAALSARGAARRAARRLAGGTALALLLAGATAPMAPAAACCQGADPSHLPKMVEAVGTMMGAFARYKASYVEPDGRVVDTANGNISHSEGQGYAMLIAAKLGDRDTFEKVWRWTRENLMVREDNLIAWKWDPTANPRVVDLNNATDGDLLVIWALTTAAEIWEEPQYLEAAREIALDLAKYTLTDTPFGEVFLPGAAGFSPLDREDGPVINLSYWVFPARDAIATVAPEFDWSTIFTNGVKILEASGEGLHKLPPEWTSLAGEAPQPADGFDAVFGFNAIRIPLYLAWAGYDGEPLAHFAGLYDERADMGPFVIDLETGAAVQPLEESGFRAIATLVECARSDDPGRAHRIDLSGAPEFYYPDTLNLLSAIAQTEMYPQCL